MTVGQTLRRWFGRTPAPVAAAAVASAPSARIRGSDNVEPQVRSYIQWTPGLIRAAQLMADGGHLRRVADLCEHILGDDRAPSVLGTRRAALLAARLTFEPAGHKGRSPRVVRALEAEQDWWTLFPETELGQLLTWGWLLGVGVGEMVNPPDATAEDRYVPTLKVWHPRWLRFDWPTRTWRLETANGEITITPGDGKWILFTPFGSSRPWAYGLWRGMSRLVLFKQYALEDWALHSEVHGQPMRVGSCPQGTTKDVRKELAADLKELGRDTAIAMPPGFDFKLVEAVAQTWQMFQAQIELANRSMAVMAVGTNLPTEVVGAAGTGAGAQHLVRQDYKKADNEIVSTMLRSQVLVWWARWNFGDERLAPWPQWDVDPPQDSAAVATLWKTVADSLVAFQNAGFKIDPQDIKDNFGIPIQRFAEPVQPGAKPPPGAPADNNTPANPDPNADKNNPADAGDKTNDQPVDQAPKK